MQEMQGQVLIVDDEPTMCKLYGKWLAAEGISTCAVHTLREGLAAAQREAFAVVLLDVGLPDGNGLEAVEEFAASLGRPEIIIITGYGGAHAAKLAMDAGVWDYVEKTDDLNRTRLSVVRALRFHRERSARESTVRVRLEGFVASSPAMGRVLADAAVAAAGDLSVAITGETGTGKELLARGIHTFSRRAAGPFVVVDCTALPETLVESTLFGHVRGAFTGAAEPRRGLVEAADGGTLFMDEIGDLPRPVQAKFLRLLQEKTFHPVGSSAPRTADFRLVTATHRDLSAMVGQEQFRQDLYYRVAGMSIHLPPLRERPGDVPLITRHHLGRLARRDGSPLKELHSDLVEALERYDWPGNVRELVNTIEIAWARGHDSPVLYPVHLPGHLRLALYEAGQVPNPPASPAETRPLLGTPRAFADERARAQEAFEGDYLRRLLAHTAGDIPQAVEASGLSRSRLYALLQKHGLSTP